MRSLLWAAVSAVVFLFGCDRVFGIGDPYADANIDGHAAAYRKTITIAQPTAVPLASFPVSILLAGDADLLAHVIDTDGRDIGFSDADDSPLPCQIVRYDAATGFLDAWVLPPELPAAPETLAIDLVYGGPDAPPTRCVTSPWPPNQLAALHGDLVAGDAPDSTTHHHDMNAGQPSSVPMVVDGVVGHALGFDGVDDTMCGLDPDGSLAVGTSSYSYSVWVDELTALAANDSPLECGGDSGTAGFGFYLGTQNWIAEDDDAAHSQALVTTLTSAPDLGRWIQLFVVVDRSANAISGYVDGVFKTSTSLTGYGSFTPAIPLCSSPAAHRFNGMVDEVQLYADAVSAQAILAQFTNIARRDSMITVGAER
jgi:hypothetical protein